jgi:hypothetical protein
MISLFARSGSTRRPVGATHPLLSDSVGRLAEHRKAESSKECIKKAEKKEIHARQEALREKREGMGSEWGTSVWKGGGLDRPRGMNVDKKPYREWEGKECREMRSRKI